MNKLIIIFHAMSKYFLFVCNLAKRSTPIIENIRTFSDDEAHISPMKNLSSRSLIKDFKSRFD